jgi:hypothetical protein
MTEEKQIQRGFNAGYSLAKQDPALSQSFQECFKGNDSPYAQGFMAGSKEWEKEQSKSASSSYNPTIIKRGSANSKQKGKDGKGFEL